MKNKYINIVMYFNIRVHLINLHLGYLHVFLMYLTVNTLFKYYPKLLGYFQINHMQ